MMGPSLTVVGDKRVAPMPREPHDIDEKNYRRLALFRRLGPRQPTSAPRPPSAFGRVGDPVWLLGFDRRNRARLIVHAGLSNQAAASRRLRHNRASFDRKETAPSALVQSDPGKGALWPR